LVSVHPTPDAALELALRDRLMEKHAQLLRDELRAARRLAEETAATLSLLVGLLANTRESDGGFLVARIFQEMLLCADTPALASQISGCEAEVIDPHMIRASAAMMTGDVDAVIKWSLGESGVAH
jgi:hypothetical protein